jgi:hypothetical protein
MQGGMKEKLVAAGKNLEDTAQRNAKALQMAQATTGRLLQTMMDEIRRELHDQSGYSKGATLTAAEKSTSVPVAVNRKI